MVIGEVVKRESVNENMLIGFVELKCEVIKIFLELEILLIYIKENLDVVENIRLKYRYLDLRRLDMYRIFEIRSKIIKVICDYLEEYNFLDVEILILLKSFLEGVRDYLVFLRNYLGMFYVFL